MTSREPAQLIRLDGFTKMLLGIIGVGFAAWAGVVYDARRLVVDLRTEIVALRGDINLMNAELIDAERDRERYLKLLMRHIDMRWHGEAGNAIATLRETDARLEHRLEALEARVK